MITQPNPAHSALSFAVVVLSTCGLFLLNAAPFLMAGTVIIYAGAIVVTFLFVLMLAQPVATSNADNRSREPVLACVAGFFLLSTLLLTCGKRTTRASTTPGSPGSMRSETNRRRKCGKCSASEEEFRQSSELLMDRMLGRERAHDIVALVLRKDDLAAARVPANAADVKKWLDDLYQAAAEQRAVCPAPPRPVRARRRAIGCRLSPARRRISRPQALSADNVAGLGRTLFSDYLLAVELAATLLLDRHHRRRSPSRSGRRTAEGRMTLDHYLVVGAALFVLGAIGFLTRRNLIVMFLSAEMMLQGVALNLVASRAIAATCTARCSRCSSSRWRRARRAWHWR